MVCNQKPMKNWLPKGIWSGFFCWENPHVELLVYDLALMQMFVSLCPGVLGIKVKIMLPWDPSGKIGPKKPLPDHVSIVEPKEEILPTTPVSEQKGAKPEVPVMPQGTPVPTA